MFQIRILALLLFVCKLQAQNDEKKFFGHMAHRQLINEKKLREELTAFTFGGTIFNLPLELNYLKSDLFARRIANNSINSTLLSMRYTTLSVEKEYGLKKGYRLNAKVFSTWTSTSNEQILFKNSFVGGSVMAGKKNNNLKYLIGIAYDTYFGSPKILPSFFVQYKYKNIIETQASPRLTYIKYHLNPSHKLSVELDNKSRFGRLNLSRNASRITELEQLDFSLVAKFEFKSTENWTANVGLGRGIYQRYKTALADINYTNNYSFNLSFSYQF